MTVDQPKSPGQIFTMAEAANRLHISRRSLQDLIKTHPHYASNGARKLFSEVHVALLWDAMQLPARRANPLFFQPATSSTPVLIRVPGVDPYEGLLRKKRTRK